MAGITAIPEQIQDVGRKATGLAQEVGGIVSAGASYLEMAGSGNSGFLTTPAMAALTVAQLAALKNLGGLIDEHGRDLGGASQTYATTEQAVVRSATPTDGSMTGAPAPAAALAGPAPAGAPVTRGLSSSGGAHEREADSTEQNVVKGR